jgi:hypothetical protein
MNPGKFELDYKQKRRIATKAMRRIELRQVQSSTLRLPVLKHKLKPEL